MRYIIFKRSYADRYEKIEFATEAEMASFVTSGKAGDSANDGYIPCQRLFPVTTFAFVPAEPWKGDPLDNVELYRPDNPPAAPAAIEQPLASVADRDIDALF